MKLKTLSCSSSQIELHEIRGEGSIDGERDLLGFKAMIVHGIVAELPNGKTSSGFLRTLLWETGDGSRDEATRRVLEDGREHGCAVVLICGTMVVPPKPGRSESVGELLDAAEALLVGSSPGADGRMFVPRGSYQRLSEAARKVRKDWYHGVKL